eukprot:1164609-Prorocentrum_minimum.AAC.1
MKCAHPACAGARSSRRIILPSGPADLARSRRPCEIRQIRPLRTPCGPPPVRKSTPLIDRMRPEATAEFARSRGPCERQIRPLRTPSGPSPDPL